MNDQNLEPAAEDLLRAGAKVASGVPAEPALFSIAISLKRIADVLQGTPGTLDIVQYLGRELGEVFKPR